MTFVHPATAAEGEAFFAERWPEVAAIADPEHALYSAFGLGRGTLWQLLGPRVWGAGLRALGGRHGVGAPQGDPMLLAGAALVAARRVRWLHRAAHSGDVVDPADVPRLGAEGAAP